MLQLRNVHRSIATTTCSLEPTPRSHKRGPGPAGAARSDKAAPLLPTTLAGLLLPRTTTSRNQTARTVEPLQLQRLPAETLLLLAAGAGAAVAADVFSSSSLHLLQPLDAAAHSWVASHLDLETQLTVAGQ
jgi:hypothetical protein